MIPFHTIASPGGRPGPGPSAGKQASGAGGPTFSTGGNHG